MEDMEKIEKIVNELREIIDEYGYEDYRKATFIMDMGVEENLNNEKVIKGIDNMYNYYLEHDYFSTPIDASLTDKFYEVVNEYDGEEE